ncbi:CpsD/CapB family tyrosine-protein kinase [Aerococcus urinae]
MFGRKKKKEIKKPADRPGLVVVDNPTSAMAEQFRTIRTNIQFSMLDKELKTFNVTSPGPASGKSFLSANIAAAFASDDKRVLLLDADMRKPTVHKTFGVSNDRGLTNLLTDNRLEIHQVIKKSYVPNLFYLTCGAIPPNPSELLASKRMQELMEQLRNVFDIIVLDCPPVLAATDAQVVSARADGTVVVVPYGQCTKDEVKESQALLDKVNTNILGVIMNRTERTEDYYYYYEEE